MFSGATVLKRAYEFLPTPNLSPL
ncbi:MAG: hypothetical protein ACYTXA_03740 [Nostoc sp.]